MFSIPTLSGILRRPGKPAHSIFESPLLQALGLLGIYLAAYGLFIPRLGYYGDDLSYAWLAYRSHEIRMFFEGNRPFFGDYFDFLTRWIGPAPWNWQILELLCRWASALAFWYLLRLIWPRQKAAGLTAAALLIVYPGFWLNSEAFTFHPFFLQLALFLFSLAATLNSLRHPDRRFLWSCAALASAFANLWVSEYFTTLELVRPVLILWGTWQPEDRWKKHLQKAAHCFLPYFALFTGFIGLRLAGIGNFAGNYPMALLDQLIKDPLAAGATLLVRILRDTWSYSFDAFFQAITFPGLKNRSLPMILLFAGALAIVALAWFLWMRRLEKTATSRSMAAIGLLTMILGGGPIWIAGLQSWGNASTSRFSLPFMSGACLLAAGLISWVPWARLRAAGYAALTACCLGYQLLLGFPFVQQVEIQKDFLWQLSARMPRLRPGTVLLTNPDLLNYNSDNSNSALVNWLYSPPGNGRQLRYYVLQNMQQFRPVSGAAAEAPERHMIGEFQSLAAVVIHYHYPNCLRVMDPELDAVHPYYSKPYRSAARLTDFSALGPGVDDRDLPGLPVDLFGVTNRPDNWCSDYQRASRAAQENDWETVAALGQKAFARGNKLVAPEELPVYISAYAYTGSWKRAGELFQMGISGDPLYTPMFCRLKDRLIDHTPDSPERSAAFEPLRCQAEASR